MNFITRGHHAALIALLLAACGGEGGQPPGTVVGQPLAMALRPQEADVLRYVVGEGEPTLSAPTVDEGAPWLHISFDAGCLPARADCREVAVVADASDGDREADRVLWPFTHDPFSREAFNRSYVTVNPFPAVAGAAPPAVRIAAGEALSAAIDTAGQVWVWGDTRAGADGNPGRSCRSQPQRVTFDPPLTRARAIAVSKQAIEDQHVRAYVLMLDDDRHVWAWGSGALYDPRAEAPMAPVLVPVGTRDVIAVAAGSRHALALRADGTVWAWGRNDFHQLGFDGAPAVPVQVLGPTRVVAIAAGANFSLALDANGVVWGWGDNRFGQLGDDATIVAPRPVAGLGPVGAISAGPDFMLALRRDGTVWSMGRNDFNQLGASSTSTCRADGEDRLCSRSPLRAAAGLGSVVDFVDAGTAFALVRSHDGSVWAWGDNRYSQLGGLPGAGSLTPVQVRSAGSVLNLAAGGRHALAMPTDAACTVAGDVGGRLVAWGDNLAGERGDGTAVNAPMATPVLTLGDDASCASTTGRRLIVMLGGRAYGTLASDLPGLQCSVVQCWQTVPDGRAVTLSATPAADAEIADWRWDCAAGGGGPSVTITMDAVHHCKLRFDPAGAGSARTLTLEFTGNGRVISEPAGLDCTATCSVGFANLATVTLSATPAPGWLFSGFGTNFDCEGGRTELNRDVRCQVFFVPDPAAPVAPVLTLAVGPGGSVGSTPAGLDCAAGLTCMQAFAAGTAVQLNPVPANGFSFVAFGGDAACTNGGIVLSVDTRCSATFEPLPGDQAVLTVQRTGPGAAGGRVATTQPDGAIDCGSACSAAYPIGTVVVLRPTVEVEGVFFSHFTGCSDTGIDGDGTPLCFVLMDTAHTVQADFE